MKNVLEPDSIKILSATEALKYPFLEIKMKASTSCVDVGLNWNKY